MYKTPPTRRNPNKAKLLIAAVILAIIVVALYFLVRQSFWPEIPPTPINRSVTLAGFNREFGEPFGVAIRDRIIYISDGDAGKIFKVSESGTVSVFAAGLNTPSAIAFDPNGDLIVADTGDHTIKRIDTAGNISTIAGVPGKSGNNDGDVSSATFNGPIGVAVAGDRIFVSDTYNDSIRVIENGGVRTIAGGSRGFAEGSGTAAQFDTPLGIAVRPDGSVLVCDSQNGRIRIVENNGTTSTLAGHDRREIADGFLSMALFTEPTAIAINSNGDAYVADGDSIRLLKNGAFPYVQKLSGGGRGFADGRLRTATFNRPSGIAFDPDIGLLVADSDNQVLRLLTGGTLGRQITGDEKFALDYKADEFRSLQPARWPFEPANAVREIAGTLGEIRGAVTDRGTSTPRFHNGLDIAGGYGETTRFLRTEKVLHPAAAENFETSRELIRMPTLGYIHVRLGRDARGNVFDDPRFLFSRDLSGRLTDIRVPRGSQFTAGDMLGTLNSMNHVHLIAGRSGAEINALDALGLPGVSDSIAPVIESVSLFDAEWRKIETQATPARNKLTVRTRVVVRAYDRVDGNAERRRLGLYRLGYRLISAGGQMPVNWTIQFDRMPAAEAAKFVYAPGSQSGATGETVFNYIVTNTVNGSEYAEGFIDPATLENGIYTLELIAADFFGNTASKVLTIEVSK